MDENNSHLSSVQRGLFSSTMDRNAGDAGGNGSKPLIANQSVTNEWDYHWDLNMSTLEIPDAFLPSKTHSTGNCWFSCNGIEFEDSKGMLHWRCARWARNLAPPYTGYSTRNMNRHLDVTYGMNKDNPSGAGIMPAANGTQHTAFAKEIHIPQLNRDLFKALLIQYILTKNISCCVVEQCIFLHLGYLMACIC